jgi:hypothetical protein
MSIPIGYNGRGTQLLWSLDNINFTPVAQLQQFEPTGSKQTLVDQTNLSTPGNFTVYQAVQADGGEIDFAGLLNPGDYTYLTLGQLHGNLVAAFWQARLVDGSVFSFQAFVSEFKPFTVKWNKLYTFSGKLRLTGGFQSPLGAFQPGAFDPLAFVTI